MHNGARIRDQVTKYGRILVGSRRVQRQRNVYKNATVEAVLGRVIRMVRRKRDCKLIYRVRDEASDEYGIDSFKLETE